MVAFPMVILGIVKSFATCHSVSMWRNGMKCAPLQFGPGFKHCITFGGIVFLVELPKMAEHIIKPANTVQWAAYLAAEPGP